MKKMFFSFAICSCISFATLAQSQRVDATAGTAQTQSEGPVLAFLEKSHEFGDIKQGEKVSYTFKFKNTGNKPLIISNVTTTCGCTVSNWTKNPVAPGQTGEVSATFNSAGKLNMQRKVITVHSNSTTGIETVAIVTNVLPASGNAQ